MIEYILDFIIWMKDTNYTWRMVLCQILGVVYLVWASKRP